MASSKVWDMSPLDSSLSDVEPDGEYASNKHKRRVYSNSKPLKCLRGSSPTETLDSNDLFLNQRTGCSFSEIRTISETNCNESDSSNCSMKDSTTNQNLRTYMFEVDDLSSIWPSEFDLNDTHINTWRRQLPIPKTVPVKLKNSKRKRGKGLHDTARKEYTFNCINENYLKIVSSALNEHDPDDMVCVLEVIVKQDQDGDRLIFIAIILKRLNLCNALLQLIPDEIFLKSVYNNMFQTPLHLAVLVGCSKLTRRFLVAGVDVDRRDRNGNTALHLACQRGNIEIANALLRPVTYLEAKQNAYDISYQKVPQDLELRNNDGLTCLLISAYKLDLRMIDLLLSKFANINAVDMKSGKTCLHIFVELGYDNGVMFLLKKPNIDLNARTYAGYTALEIANCRNHSYIAYRLLCTGAKPRIRSADSSDFKAESDSD